MTRYPVPSAQGGRLIRTLIKTLRANKIDIPIASHIHIAVSGGADSIALAHLIARYGRRIIPFNQISFIHIDHSWRGAASRADARLVQRLGRSLGVPTRVIRLKSEKTQVSGESWEALARDERKKIFQKLSQRHRSLVLTAHQADDLAETLLWRLFTGQAQTHGAGILVSDGVELRPCLRVRKRELVEYLRAEGVVWSEDSTNQDPRFLRARLRLDIIPAVEAVFPRAIEHLVELAHAAVPTSEDVDPSILNALFAASGIQARRAHWQEIKRWLRFDRRQKQLHLEQGWRLLRSRGGAGIEDRWVLEKTTPTEGLEKTGKNSKPDPAHR